ncbi:hypothetical protein HDU96_000876 [Phlyctochytrium bullatum]|nr:hypothetical protein HDU96_000876 [Phlyctochytrium bullatum]
MSSEHTPLLDSTDSNHLTKPTSSATRLLRATALALVAGGIGFIVGAVAFLHRSPHAPEWSGKVDAALWSRSIDAERTRFGVMGCAVGVVVDGEVAFLEGFGWRDEREGRVTAETIFQIGSTTKAFTAFAAASVVEERKVNWSTPVSSVFPVTFMDDVATAQASLVDIMSHRTGLPRHDAFQFYFTSPSQVLQKIPHLPPTHPFRSTYQYNNHMFTLAGHLSAHLSNRSSWEDLIHSTILEPAAMKGSFAKLEDALKITNRARGFTVLEGRPVTYDEGEVVNFMPAFAPAGGLWSSATDMTKWMNLMLNESVTRDGKRLLSPENYAKLLFPHTPISHGHSYGLGWHVGTLRSRPYFFHGGATVGYTSNVAILPAQKAGSGEGLTRDLPALGVVVLVNHEAEEGGGHFAEAITKAILGSFIGEPDPWKTHPTALHSRLLASLALSREEIRLELASRKNNTHPSRPPSSFAGTYLNRAYGRCRIVAGDNPLTFELHIDPDVESVPSPARKLRLVHWEEDTLGVMGLSGVESPVPMVKLAFEGEGTEEEPKGFVRIRTVMLGIPVVFERVRK